MFFFYREVNISLPKSTLKNGSLYVHVYLGPKGKSPLRHSDMDDLSAAVAPLTRYAIPQSTVYSLLTGSDQSVSNLVKNMHDVKCNLVTSLSKCSSERCWVQLECWIFASKNWARLEHNYYFCAEFLEEVWYALLFSIKKGMRLSTVLTEKIALLNIPFPYAELQCGWWTSCVALDTLAQCTQSGWWL